MGAVQYQQLEMLENAGKIISTRSGLYSYYFTVGMLDSDKDILQVLSKETARKILVFIIGEGNPTQTEISDKIMISSASGSWHIKVFTKTGLIGEEKKGEYKRYHFNWDSTGSGAHEKLFPLNMGVVEQYAPRDISADVQRRRRVMTEFMAASIRMVLSWLIRQIESGEIDNEAEDEENESGEAIQESMQGIQA